MLVLCVARYELLDQRPGGGGLGDSLNLYLEPLPLEEATELALEAGEGLETDAARSVAENAGGNPFFIVETTLMLMQARAELSGAGLSSSPRLPPTVQAVIAQHHRRRRPASWSARPLVFRRATFHAPSWP